MREGDVIEAAGLTLEVLDVPGHSPGHVAYLIRTAPPKTKAPEVADTVRDGRLPRPSMGSWVTYGLGSENQNLPGFIAMCPGGYPIVATQNWRSAFLPGAYQGTYINTRNTDIRKLIEHIKNENLSLSQQRRQLGNVGQSGLFREAHEDAAQQADRAFSAFDVAAQPEEIIGCTAG